MTGRLLLAAETDNETGEANAEKGERAGSRYREVLAILGVTCVAVPRVVVVVALVPVVVSVGVVVALVAFVVVLIVEVLS